MRDSYTFTVITPAYNAEKYLEEAVQSIIEQDIGFETDVQLILVDDASKDRTGEICDGYAAQYPENIQVVHMPKRSGSSAARNAGLDLARGRYIHFLDADDKLFPTTMRLVSRFMEANSASTDVVEIPLYQFNENSRLRVIKTPTTPTFTKVSRIVSLEDLARTMIPNLHSTFIRAEALKGLRFKTKLKFGASVELMMRLMVNKPKLGVLSRCRYMTRSSAEEPSAADKLKAQPEKYTNYVEDCYLSVIKDTIAKCGYLPRFLANNVWYKLKGLIKAPYLAAEGVMNAAALAKWKSGIVECLRYIDDDIIAHTPDLLYAVRAHLLHLKNGDSFAFTAYNEKLAAAYHGVTLRYVQGLPLNLDFIKEKDDTYELSGSFVLPKGDGKEPQIVFVVDEEIIHCEQSHDPLPLSTKLFGEQCYVRLNFKGVIPNVSARKRFRMTFAAEWDGQLYELDNLVPHKYFPLTRTVKKSYCHIGNHIVSYSERGLKFAKYSVARHIRRELAYMFKMLFAGRAGAFSSILTRAAYWLTKPFAPKNIWVLSDRVNKADDNGEAFFRYLLDEGKEKNIYYAIRKDSPDYKRLGKIGKVLSHMSLKHVLCYLHAEFILSSQATFYPKAKREHFFLDLLRKRRFIFLQHGIILNDLSYWLHPTNVDMSIFVTSTPMEYESIAFSPLYGYGPEIVKLTGMPRFDLRKDAREKVITIMPTWRTTLFTKPNQKTGEWEVDEQEFINSDYYQFYKALLTSETIQAKAKELGYRLWFIPHPNVAPLSHLFDFDGIEVKSSLETSYGEIYSKSALIVTDYSSSVMDFAYMRKPIVYAQFDHEEFMLKYSTAESFFNFETQGFGEVEYNLEDTVERVIEYMENDCKTKEKYLKRIDEFFAFRDHDNSKRVYEEVIKLRD